MKETLSELTNSLAAYLRCGKNIPFCQSKEEPIRDIKKSDRKNIVDDMRRK
jgi:hypothetical protein